MTRPCRCGCGVGVAAPRVFLNKAHQIAWLRAQGAKRRKVGAPGRPSAATTPSGPTVRSSASGPAQALPTASAPPEPAPVPISATDAAASPSPFGTLLDRMRSGTEEPVGTDTRGLASGEPESLSLAGEIYVVGFTVTALPVFLATWLLSAAAFGLPLGGGLGWIPALVAAAGAGAVWPLGLLAGTVVALVAFT